MSSIRNTSLYDFERTPDTATYALRIVDTASQVKHTPKNYSSILMLVFNDCEPEEDGYPTPSQIQSILFFLRDAKSRNKNVVVHCMMGIGRSAAIAQFAIDFMGFINAEPSTDRTHMNTALYSDLQYELSTQVN
jgi:protein-tyrosine phosphatase